MCIEYPWTAQSTAVWPLPLLILHSKMIINSKTGGSIDHSRLLHLKLIGLWLFMALYIHTRVYAYKAMHIRSILNVQKSYWV